MYIYENKISRLLNSAQILNDKEVRKLDREYPPQRASTVDT
jgi:hypothetical protein